jgi:lysophospholipase L1-like esterase
MARRHLAVLVLTAAVVLTVATPAGAATPPGSMAAAGDSITRAFNVNGAHFLSDAPDESWSTGRDTAVRSVAQRLRALSPTLTTVNVAKTGAKMVDLDGQLSTAATAQVGFVTVLMGANDVCTSTVAGMTPTATFQGEFQQALTDFTTADPSAVVQVSSIPNIYQLWTVLHTNSAARTAWALFGVCKSMLSSKATEQQRQLVLAQLEADNAALATVCATYTACRWDGGAAFNASFTPTQISTVDYFHPSVAGQALLAATEWSAGPYAG